MGFVLHKTSQREVVIMADPRRAAALAEAKPDSPEEFDSTSVADSKVPPSTITLSAAAQSRRSRGQLLHLQLAKGYQRASSIDALR